MAYYTKEVMFVTSYERQKSPPAKNLAKISSSLLAVKNKAAYNDVVYK